METFSNGQAYELIKAGLQSETIKLIGSHTNREEATKRAEADAAYLLTLLSRLQQGPEK